MSKTIDTGITEQDLFEAVMQDLDPLPRFDPTIHFDPQIAADRWNVHRSTAIERLERDKRLKKIKVRGKAGHPVVVFIRAD